MNNLYQDKGYTMNGLNSIFVNTLYQIYSIKSDMAKLKRNNIFERIKILYYLEYAKYDTKRFCNSLTNYTSDTLLDLFLFISTAKVNLTYNENKFNNFKIDDETILSVDTENRQLIITNNSSTNSDTTHNTYFIKYYTDRIKVITETEYLSSNINKRNLISHTYDINILNSNLTGDESADYQMTKILIIKYISIALSVITIDIYKNLKKMIFEKENKK